VAYTVDSAGEIAGWSVVDVLVTGLNVVYSSGCTVALLLLLWFFLVDDR